MNVNKVALITGANKGIGLEIARQLGQQGITVVVGSRDKGRGQAAADTLKGEGIDAHTVTLNVTDAGDVAALPAYFEGHFGRLDILVNNAAILDDGQGVTPDLLRRTLEANVVAPYAITEALLPLIQAAPAGRIVNQSSILGSIAFIGSGEMPEASQVAAYSASKAALNMLTVSLASRLAGTPVKVNCCHPGSVKTDMNPGGNLTTQEGAKSAVKLSLLPEDGATGTFTHQGEALHW